MIFRYGVSLLEGVKVIQRYGHTILFIGLHVFIVATDETVNLLFHMGRAMLQVHHLQRQVKLVRELLDGRLSGLVEVHAEYLVVADTMREHSLRLLQGGHN